ncbi:flagellar basal body rod C-terminal domain-containing protein [uncultured Desulfovibrio sp.]|uniref:flagellar basal body rod C-terminal domain-containing protein n=1 Tax=uncultured Desulfovibrio sp. TaxID=167968 RepID=UPI0003A0E48F|nr:flagellar basal body rod C-terminal domain-containing protein [uncultured Desulfovibrio sp.]
MSGITDSMYIGALAMNAHSWGMAVTAHNVANVNTAGFTPQQAVYATGPGGRGVRLDAVLQDAGAAGRLAAGTDNDPSMPPEVVNPSGTDLGREMTQMISTQRTYEANARTVRASDAMLGALLDLNA